MSDWKDVLPKRVEEEIELKKDKDINYNQKTLCKNIGISEATLSLLLKGERNPRIDTIIALAKEFNVDVDYLIGTTNFKKRPSSEKDIEMEQLCKMFGLNEESIKNLLHSDLGVNYPSDNAADTLDAIFGKAYWYNQLMWKLQNYFMFDNKKPGGAYVVSHSAIKDMTEDIWDEEMEKNGFEPNSSIVKLEVEGEVDDFYDNYDGKSYLTPSQYEDLLFKDIMETLKFMKKYSNFEIHHLKERIIEINDEIKAIEKNLSEGKINPEGVETIINNYKDEKKKHEEEIKTINECNKKWNWPED